jgi:hypothetical protein
MVVVSHVDENKRLNFVPERQKELQSREPQRKRKQKA